jgi:hypothetical protein
MVSYSLLSFELSLTVSLFNPTGWDIQYAKHPVWMTAIKAFLMQLSFKFWFSAHHHRHLIPVPQG